MKSGLAERSRCTSVVASLKGGVNTSSTTTLTPSFSKPPSRSGLTKACDAAVLSETMATVVGRLPATCSAMFSTVGIELSASTLATGTVCTRYLKPRPVS